MFERWTENLALVLLLAIVGLRPLVSESFHTAANPLSDALADLQDPWTTTTLFIDALILSTAALALGARLRARRTWTTAGLKTGFVFLLLAALVSSCFAGEKRPAINASIDLLACVTLAFALAQLLDSEWKLRVAMYVIIASGATNAAESAYQRFVSFAETERQYNEHREEIWERQGVSLDSPQVQLFEQRMKAREAMGYFAHSNVAGAYMLLAGFAAVALAWGAWVCREDWSGLVPVVFSTLIAPTILGAILLTRSTGAIAAGILGLLLLVIRLAGAPWFAAHRRTVFRAAWATVGVVTGGVIALGLVRGGLPGASLDFRWHYWTAAAEMFAEHGLTGVGAENFGDHYLAYKSILAPEEVQNPHNFLVQFATEYGVLGLVAVLLLLAGGSRILTRPASRDALRDAPAAAPMNIRAQVASLGAVFALILIGRYALLPTAEPAMIAWTQLFTLVTWAPVAALLLVTFADVDPISGGSSRWGAALNCGLLVFLLQDTINFALFVPGARTTFFALVGISAAIRAPQSEKSARTRGNVTIWLLCSLVALIALISLEAVMRAEVLLRVARDVVLIPTFPLAEQPSHGFYEKATILDPLDATPPTEHARWLLAVAASADDRSLAREAARRSLQAVDMAIARAPHRYGLWRLKAQAHSARHRISGDEEELHASIAALRRALELYPTRPMTYVELGDRLMELGDCESTQQAIARFEEALALDASRPAWEVLRRFTDKQVAEIRARIQQADQQRSQLCPGDVED